MEVLQKMIRGLGLDTRLLWACKIILEIFFLMISNLFKLYVVIKIPPRNIKMALLHDLCKALHDHFLIIPFFAFSRNVVKLVKSVPLK